MNRQLFLDTADAIEARPDHFDISTWYKDLTPAHERTHEHTFRFSHSAPIPDLTDPGCNTAGCIAGWMMSLDQPNGQYNPSSVIEDAAAAADLEYNEATALFCSFERSAEEYNWWVSNGLIRSSTDPVTPAIAVQALRRIASGELTLPPDFPRYADEDDAEAEDAAERAEDAAERAEAEHEPVREHTNA